MGLILAIGWRIGGFCLGNFKEAHGCSQNAPASAGIVMTTGTKSWMVVAGSICGLMAKGHGVEG